MEPRKGFATSLLILVLACIALLVGAYVYEHAAQRTAGAGTAPQATSTAQIATTSAPKVAQPDDWTKFISTQLGFSVQYPESWGQPKVIDRFNTTVVTLTPGFSIVIGLLPGQNDTPVTYQDLYAYSKAEAIKEGTPITDTTIGGRPAFVQISRSPKTGGVVQVYAYAYYSPGYNNYDNIFEVTYGLNPSRNLTQSDIDLFNHIVSTITFDK